MEVIKVEDLKEFFNKCFNYHPDAKSIDNIDFENFLDNKSLELLRVPVVKPSDYLTDGINLFKEIEE